MVDFAEELLTDLEEDVTGEENRLNKKGKKHGAHFFEKPAIDQQVHTISGKVTSLSKIFTSISSTVYKRSHLEAQESINTLKSEIEGLKERLNEEDPQNWLAEKITKIQIKKDELKAYEARVFDSTYYEEHKRWIKKELDSKYKIIEEYEKKIIQLEEIAKKSLGTLEEIVDKLWEDFYQRGEAASGSLDDPFTRQTTTATHPSQGFFSRVFSRRKKVEPEKIPSFSYDFIKKIRGLKAVLSELPIELEKPFIRFLMAETKKFTNTEIKSIYYIRT